MQARIITISLLQLSPWSTRRKRNTKLRYTISWRTGEQDEQIVFLSANKLFLDSAVFRDLLTGSLTASSIPWMPIGQPSNILSTTCDNNLGPEIDLTSCTTAMSSASAISMIVPVSNGMLSASFTLSYVSNHAVPRSRIAAGQWRSFA